MLLFSAKAVTEFIIVSGMMVGLILVMQCVQGELAVPGESLSSAHHLHSQCLPAELGVISSFTEVNHFKCGFEPLWTINCEGDLA